MSNNNYNSQLNKLNNINEECIKKKKAGFYGGDIDQKRRLKSQIYKRKIKTKYKKYNLYGIKSEEISSNSNHNIISVKDQNLNSNYYQNEEICSDKDNQFASEYSKIKNQDYKYENKKYTKRKITLETKEKGIIYDKKNEKKSKLIIKLINILQKN